MGLARVGAGRVRGVVVCVRRPLLLVNEQGGGGRCGKAGLESEVAEQVSAKVDQI